MSTTESAPQFPGGMDATRLSTRSVLNVARELASAGFSVIPVAPGTKWPAVPWKEYTNRLPSDAELARWFGHDRKVGIGKICGRVSGNLEVIDLDVDPALQPFDVFELLRQLRGRVGDYLFDRLTIVQTPRPGFHIQYRCDMPVGGSLKLAGQTRKDGTPHYFIETRGEGGQALDPCCPPGIHPSGGVYEHVGGPPVLEMSVISKAERDTLIEAARLFCLLPKEKPAPEPKPKPERNGRPDGDLSPWDDFEQRATWREVLEPAGWECLDDKTFRHPNATNEQSAVVNDSDRLVVFSTNTPFEHYAGGDAPTQSKFWVYAALFYNGNSSQAARQLYREGFGSRWNGHGAPEWNGRSGVRADGGDLQRADHEAGLPTFAGSLIADLWPMADERVDWLVDSVFAADQPTVFGARKKSLKTTLLTDFVVALATRTKWLSPFSVPRTRRVLFLTGEANNRAAIRRVRRAVRARNLGRDACGENLRVEAIHMPKLANAEHRVALQRDVERHRLDVVVLDPLYRSMSGSTNAGNLFDVGELLGWFQDSCRPASIVIAHHLKASARFDTYPDLDDLSQAGVAEFAGNYWLMGRFDEYRGDGQHNLAVAYGGRDEQFGAFRMLFDERDWSAAMMDLSEYQAAAESERKQRAENVRVNTMTGRIKQALGRHPNGLSESRLAGDCGTRPGRGTFIDALDSLRARGEIELIEDFKSGTKTCSGWRMVGTDRCPDTPSEVSFQW